MASGSAPQGIAGAPSLESKSSEVSADPDPEADEADDTSTQEPLASLEEPVASGAQALTEAECNERHLGCFRSCWTRKPPWPLKKGDAGHYKYCQSKCLAEYMKCLAGAGVLRTFASLVQATAWVKSHSVAVGTIVLVAGVAYVVSTAGAGSLILVPAAL